MDNRVNELLRAGKTVIGTMVAEFNDPNLPKMLAACGFDFFVIDCQHAFFDYKDVACLTTVGRGYGITPMVRAPNDDLNSIRKYLDLGIQGIILPEVDSADQARRAVRASKYAPAGKRGLALTRVHTGYQKINPAAYMAQANEEILIIPQIESAESVANIDQITAVDGVDGVFVGPNDLSSDLGMYGQYTNQKYLDAVDRVIAGSRNNGKFYGMHTSSIEDLNGWMDKGMQFIIWHSEITLLMEMARGGIAKLKEHAKRS